MYIYGENVAMVSLWGDLGYVEFKLRRHFIKKKKINILFCLSLLGGSCKIMLILSSIKDFTSRDPQCKVIFTQTSSTFRYSIYDCHPFLWLRTSLRWHLWLFIGCLKCPAHAVLERGREMWSLVCAMSGNRERSWSTINLAGKIWDPRCISSGDLKQYDTISTGWWVYW